MNSILVMTVVASMSGCATILSDRRYPVTIDNADGPTFFSVQDRKHNVIHQGVTPQQVTLDAKAFPYWPAKYSIAFAGAQSATQVKEVKAGLDPWSAGNLLLGGIPGFAVDGASGAMFKLPKSIQGSVPSQYAVTNSSQGSQLIATAMQSASPRISDLDGGGVLSETTQGMPSSSDVQMASATEPINTQGDIVTR
ncbi:hypothetical protein N9N28_13995 [Rubripirellula amarantea]|nr:hypothetical protein [Rubripirellula amarantea]